MPGGNSYNLPVAFTGFATHPGVECALLPRNLMALVVLGDGLTLDWNVIRLRASHGRRAPGTAMLTRH